MAAVFKGHDDIALRIIRAGATPHIQDKVNNITKFCYQLIQSYSSH